jgi:hypothetical protein
VHRIATGARFTRHRQIFLREIGKIPLASLMGYGANLPVPNVISATFHTIDDHVTVASICEMLLDCAIRTVRVAYKDLAILLDQVIQLAANYLIQPGNRSGTANEYCRLRLLRVRVNVSE